MKVLFCVYRDSELSGGSFRVAEVAIKSMVARGAEVHVAVAYGGGGRLAKMPDVRYHLIAAKTRNDLHGWQRYRSLVKQISPDVIHYVECVGWMVLAAAGLSAKRVMHTHYRPDIGSHPKRHITFIRLLFGGATGIVCISHGAARTLHICCKINRDKIHVIHNAVDLDRFRLSSKAPGVTTKLGMAIRVVEDKGIADALTLLRVLPETYILAIAGDGPAVSKMKEMARTNGVDHRVEWRGAVDDVASFYQEIDYYLFMSWYEGFGLSVAEAMATGVPVVGLLGDGEISEPEYPLVTPRNSILVNRSCSAFASEPDVNVIEHLANEIQELNADSLRRLRMIEDARRWIEERFSLKIYGKRLHSLYGGMVGS